MFFTRNLKSLVQIIGSSLGMVSLREKLHRLASLTKISMSTQSSESPVPLDLRHASKLANSAQPETFEALLPHSLTSLHDTYKWLPWHYLNLKYFCLLFSFPIKKLDLKPPMRFGTLFIASLDSRFINSQKRAKSRMGFWNSEVRIGLYVLIQKVLIRLLFLSLTCFAFYN